MDEIVLRAVERAINTMRAKHGDRLSVDDLARSAMFSKFHFSRLFQRVTGVSPGRFLSAIRLNEAKRLLVTTSLTVADISHQVGYNSVGTFSSRFRHSVGVSPTTYRQLGGVTRLPLPAAPATAGTTSIRGHVTAPAAGPLGPVFVGLFPSRILEAPAVTGVVVPGTGPYALSNVPPGTWHVLAYATGTATSTATGTPETTAYIGIHGPIVIQPQITAHLVDVRLRPHSAFDPPVLMAIPTATSYAAGAAS